MYMKIYEYIYSSLVDEVQIVPTMNHTYSQPVKFQLSTIVVFAKAFLICPAPIAKVGLQNKAASRYKTKQNWWLNFEQIQVAPPGG